MVTLREATPADDGAIAAVHDAAIRAFATEQYDAEQIEAWASLSEGDDDTGAADGRADDGSSPVDEEKQSLVVAEHDGRVVGFGHLAVATGEIVAVYVHPDAARAGVGSRLLDRLESRAREAGLAELTLSASLNAVVFYEKLGYERVERTTHELQAGLELPCVAMCKRL